MFDLKRAYRKLQRIHEAEVVYRRVIKIRQNMVPNDAVKLGITMYKFGTMLLEAGRLEESIQIYRKVLAIDEAHYGAFDANLVDDLNALASALEKAGQNAVRSLIVVLIPNTASYSLCLCACAVGQTCRTWCQQGRRQQLSGAQVGRSGALQPLGSRAYCVSL